VPVILEVNYASLDQVDPATRQTLCSYDYKDIEGFAVVCHHCCLKPFNQNQELQFLPGLHRYFVTVL